MLKVRTDGAARHGGLQVLRWRRAAKKVDRWARLVIPSMYLTTMFALMTFEPEDSYFIEPLNGIHALARTSLYPAGPAVGR
jgi:hypothetical protein